VGPEHSCWYQGLCWSCTRIEMFEGKTKNLERKNKRKKENHLKFSNPGEVAAYSLVLTAWQRPR
jgi:hypothetical protein